MFTYKLYDVNKSHKVGSTIRVTVCLDPSRKVQSCSSNQTDFI